MSAPLSLFVLSNGNSKYFNSKNKQETPVGGEAAHTLCGFIMPMACHANPVAVYDDRNGYVQTATQRSGPQQ